MPPPEPPVPVLPDCMGSILLMQTLKFPARSPPGICSCRSTGVPSPAPLVHVPAVTAQLGQVTSAKQTGPVQPFVKAGISVYGETAVDGGDGLCEKPIRTGLPPLFPVSVMLKHFAGAVPPDDDSSIPIPQPQALYIASTTVAPIMQQLPVVHGFAVVAGQDVPSP